MKKGKERHFLFNYTSLILLITFLIIPLSFFFLLSLKVIGEEFGLTEIFISIILSVLMTAFLSWNKSLTLRNPYLGTLLGLIVLGFLEYALFMKYQGPYTTTYAIISGLIVLGFLTINFNKGLKSRKAEDDFYEDNPVK